MFETLDGYTVTQNPATGYYEVAQVSADGNVLQPAPSPALTLRFLHGKRTPRLEAVEP